MRTVKFVLLFIGLCILGVIGNSRFNAMTLSSAHPPATQHTSQQSIASTKDTTQVTSLQHESITDNGIINVPQSLMGVIDSTHLPTDAEGRLVISIALKQFIDTYLSSLGEAELDELITLMHMKADAQLTPDDASRVKTIIEQYIDYKRAIDDVLASQPATSQQFTLAAIESVRFEAKGLRTEIFDAEVNTAFFAQDDEYHDYMLARHRILQDELISDAEKAANLQQLLTEAPQWLQLQMSQSQAINDYHRNTQQALIQLDEIALQDWRREQFGHEAAERLQQLDIERAEWKQKLDNYRTQANKIKMNSEDDEEVNAQLLSLRASLFTSEEQRRVQALERLGELR